MPSPRILRIALLAALGLRALAMSLNAAAGPVASDPQHEVAPGYSTTRQIPGEPFDLAGNRIIFSNWRYVVPGDNFDWKNAKGESVYVKGSEGLYGAQYVGNNTPWGIRLVTRKPTLMEPFEHPNPIQDGKRYLGWDAKSYYESSDAIHWQKKADLVISGKSGRWGIGMPFLDPSAPPAERFKSISTEEIDEATLAAYNKAHPGDWNPRAFLHFAKDHTVDGIRGAVSPDGIHWTILPEPLVIDYCDTLNTAYYDAVLRRYVLYTRFWAVNPYTSKQAVDVSNGWTGIGRRAIGRSESPDFRHFPPAELILEAKSEMSPAEELYTNCHSPMPGAPDQHLFFPSVWDTAHDSTSTWLATSADGKVWSWAPGGPLIETGTFGQWNGGCVWVTPQLMELPNGDWAIPITGQNVPHKYPRGQRKGASTYAIWPKGRLIGIEATAKGGFSLAYIMPPGRTVKINAVTRRVGGIRVEVDKTEGHTFADCDPLVGDLPWTTVTWKGQSDFGMPKDRPVRLRFELDSGTIYGLEFD